MSAFINLMRATNALSTASSRRCADAGLTHSQFGVMEALYHLGPMPQKSLGEKLLRTSGNITMVVHNLERDGLVERRRGSDRRFVTVSLTARGRGLIRKILPKQVAGIVRDLARLNDDEQDELRRLCRVLGNPEEK